jgi:hypothetical protein
MIATFSLKTKGGGSLKVSRFASQNEFKDHRYK